MPTPTLIQKTRGTQSSANTPAPASSLMLTSQEETACFKACTKAQSEVISERSVPFIDLQNHADNSNVNTDKTGLKGYFNQATLNNVFGWDTVGNSFKSFLGSAGKILPGFLDPTWVASLLTNQSAINTNQNIKLDRKWFDINAIGNIDLIQRGENAQVEYSISQFAQDSAIVLPTHNLGDVFNLYFELGFEIIMRNTGAVASTVTDINSGAYIQFNPWYKEQVGLMANSNVVIGPKRYFYTFETGGAGSQQKLRLGNLRQSFTQSGFTSCYAYNGKFNDFKAIINSNNPVINGSGAVVAPNGIRTRLDFGFDLSYFNNGNGTPANVANLFVLPGGNSFVDKDLKVDIYRG